MLLERVTRSNFSSSVTRKFFHLISSLLHPNIILLVFSARKKQPSEAAKEAMETPCSFRIVCRRAVGGEVDENRGKHTCGCMMQDSRLVFLSFSEISMLPRMLATFLWRWWCWNPGKGSILCTLCSWVGDSPLYSLQNGGGNECILQGCNSGHIERCACLWRWAWKNERGAWVFIPSCTSNCTGGILLKSSLLYFLPLSGLFLLPEYLWQLSGGNWEAPLPSAVAVHSSSFYFIENWSLGKRGSVLKIPYHLQQRYQSTAGGGGSSKVLLLWF